MNSLIKSTSDFLDRPGFNWKGLILGFTAANFAFETYLKIRQIRCVEENGNKIPKQLEGKIDLKTVVKSSEYSISKLKFSIFSGIFNLIENTVFIKYDILPKLWLCSRNLIQWLLPSFINSNIMTSLFFLGQFTLLSIALSLPIQYYQNFVLEEKFGFNKLTIKLWITDTLKQLMLSVVLGAPFMAGFLKIIDFFGDSFMYYLSLFLFVVQIFFIIVYPKFIQPLFNKLEPLQDGELKTEIEELAKKNKFPLDKLYVIDGSKRSSHSNAYFLGLPWGSKQIVIYDTLIEHSTIKEVVAVLGHEIGHWSLSHTTKLMIIGQVHLFSIFTIFAAFINNKSLFQSFGFINEQPVIIGFLLFSDILKPLDAVLEFGMNLLSRTYEYQADAYAVNQGFGTELKTSLINLHKENLSSLVVDWLYSAQAYNHPHLVERLAYIDEVMDQTKEKDN